MHVRPAAGGPDHAAVKELILAYAREHAEALGDQDFWDEVHWLPEQYGPPDGALLVAESEGRIVGCVAYERLNATTCRMKRMVVTPEARGKGIGKALCSSIVDTARAAGYRRMVLDTTPGMTAAQAIYRAQGFDIVEPDWESPCKDPVYMARPL